ncbi:MAG: DegT/DnrJ/EryC1/StrS family aminotransferase [Microbacteriaceae bacterium]|nr:DegT/DnrJ/EryC1/StrS family aminotransferase [Microbacteriaceae bacterium]
MGVSSAHAFPYARTALYFALKAQNFEPGSEIIMPPVTIKPMMDIVISLGLKPVFADIELDTLCFDLDELKKAINPKTRAILITYLFGIVPNLDPLMALCREHDLFVVEDYSHALNASWHDKKLGTFGNVGIYSCSKTKTVDAYGGGLAVTNDQVLAKHLEEAKGSLKPTPPARLRAKIMDTLIFNVATRRPVFTAAVAPMLSLVEKTNPEKAKALTGARQNLKPDTALPEDYFEQFTSAQAEAGLAMLEKVGREDDKRISNAAELRRLLVGLGEPCARTIKHGRSVYWQFVVFAADAERFRKALANRGIDTATTNLSLVCSLGIYPEYEKECPNAERVKNNAMYIAVYPRLGKRALKHVIDAIPYALERSG